MAELRPIIDSADGCVATKAVGVRGSMTMTSISKPEGFTGGNTVIVLGVRTHS